MHSDFYSLPGCTRGCISFLTLLTLFLMPADVTGQADGDYRSAATGNWNAAATWERFNGGTMMWEAAINPPSSSDGVISIRSPHVVAANTTITADQVVVDMGGTLTVTSTFNLNNGTGDDLVVDGTLDFQVGTLGNNGSILINAPGTLTATTAGFKTLNDPIVNNGSIDWQSGFFIPTASSGASITNNGTFSFNGPLFQDNGGTGTFVNNGTITKTSAGTTDINNFNVSNIGTFNINAGTINRSNGSFTNTGTINLSTASFSNGLGTFNHNTGSMILGSGSFSNGGTLQLNIDLSLPAAIPFSNSGTVDGVGNLTVNNDFTLQGTLQGNGTLTVNGNTTWNSGTLDRTFTNQVGRMLTLGTASSKTLSAPLVNDGTMAWSDGFLILNAGGGSSFTNNGTFTMNGSLFQDNGGFSTVINNGTITKTSGGTTSITNFIFSNPGTVNVNAGDIIRSGGSWTNTGTINLSSASFTSSSGTFNHNTGSMILGSGSFSNGGTLQLNIDLSFPAPIPFSNSGTVDGTGNLTVNNDFTLQGTIQGSGTLTVNGNTTWNSGTLDRTFTNQAGRMLSLGTASSKTLSAPLVNDGTMTWSDGNFILNAVGGSSFTNNGTFNMNGPLFQDNGGFSTVINNGTITKTSGGTTSITNFGFSNPGTMNVNAGGIAHAGGSWTNTGTINLNAASLAMNSGTFNHNTGSTILGSGSFSNGGTLQLNINLSFPAAIPFSNSGTVDGAGNLTVNNDFTLQGTIKGSGTLTVNGNTTWNSGTLDRTFTNQVGRMLTLGTVNSKSLSAPLVNDGTMTWSDGNLVLDAGGGSSFTNNGTFTMNGPLFQDNGGVGTVINNGTITKTSGGSTAINNFAFSNSGTFNVNAGAIAVSGASFTNTGTINLSAANFANNGGTFNHNTGSMILGSGSFSNGGTLQLNIDLSFPAAIPFSNSGIVDGSGNLTVNNDFTLQGTIKGSGTLTVNGNTTWNSGTLDRTFTNQVGRMLTLGTVNSKSLSAPLVNDGTMTWSDGNLVLDAGGGSSFTNNGTFTMNGPLFQDNGGTGTVINNGTITRSNSGSTSVNNFNFTNSASGHIKGIGTISFGGAGSFTNNGFIDPGQSPGVLTIHNRPLFSANSTLAVEVQSNGGVGTGHDQLVTNTAQTLNGALSISLLNGFQPAAGDDYTILSYPSRTDTFDTVSPCWLIEYGATSTTITYDPVFFETCPANIMQNNESMLCTKVVSYTVSAIGSPPPALAYAFSGATTGNGSGTGSGSVFNVGMTTVSITANNGCSNDTCTFIVTILDIENPIIDCPDDITQNNDAGECAATVSFMASATDNCTIASIIYSPLSGSDFPVGTTMVTATATDVNGLTASCTFEVTVNDTELPTVDCPDNVTVSNNTGTCGAVVNYSVLFDDNCPGEMLLQTAGLPSGSTFPIGLTTNTFRVTDASGNSTTCSFTVTVNDTELPTIDCPDNIVDSNDAGVCGAVVNYVVTFDDNCAGESLLQIAGLASGSTFPTGVTVNTFRVTDASGNSTTCSFTVTVNDTELPTIDCADEVTVNNDSGECGAIVNYSVTGDDNCPGESIMQTTGLPSGSTFPVGSTTNTFRVTDASGNSSTCSFDVIVNDAEDPDITCPGNIVVSDPESDGEVVNYNVTSDDNCAGEILQQTAGLPSGSVFPVGMTNNSFLVTDASGNTNICSFTVTVVTDTECDPPVGTACNDGDACTIDDVIGADCLCAGTFHDSDGDGTCDAEDGCPDDPDKTEPGICGCGVSDDDTDGDGTADCLDGCPDDPDKTEPGICGCGVADEDSDGDGTADCLDGCPDDPDKTEPGVCGCGVSDDDTDGDGTEDCLDGCPGDPDKTEPGVCGCGVPDEDLDGDGVEDCNDLCPDGPEPGSPCDDGDELTVNDMIGADCLCAGTPIECIDDGQCDDGDPCTEDLCDNGICMNVPLPDSDGDGICDAQDGCPNDPDKTEPGICGCGISDDDTDGDGVADCNDGCPDDPDNTDPGICGCGVADDDSDGDGTADCNDDCPDDPNKTEPGDCGCGVSDEDSDGDGTADCEDGCPADPNKTAPGQCGCGIADTDSDGDGTADCNDECPNDPEKITDGICGCGNPEPGTACDDGNPNTVNDVITTNCTCEGVELGETCNDGIQNGDEEGIDCGGSCAPCQPPVAVCAILSVYVNPNAPVYDGPGTNNIWWIPAVVLGEGSSSDSESPTRSIRRHLNNILFNWTTQGACIDATPNGLYNNRDQGTIYRNCLPVTNADFNKWRNYQFRISDQFGSDECYGKVRVVPQVPSYSAPSVHVVIPDIEADVPNLSPDTEEMLDSSLPGDAKEAFMIVPNPGADRMQIQWHALQSEKGNVKILDAAGRIIFDQDYEILEGENVILIDMSDAESGLYLVRLNADSGNRFGKWMKIQK